MIRENEFDRLLTSWLETEGPQDVPTDVVEAALASARRQGQLGGWLDSLLGRRWPVDPTGIWSPGGRRLVTLALVALLTVALVGAGVLVGATLQDRSPAPPAPSELLAPSAAAPSPALVRSGPPRFARSGAMSVVRQYPALVKLKDGRVLVLGGTGLERGTVAEMEIYDPASGTFRSSGTLPTPGSGFSATLLDDGRVLIAGGADPSKTMADGPSYMRGIKTAGLYDPATATFVPTGPMNMGHGSHAALRLKDGRVLVVDPGGRSELYDPRTETWSVLPEVSTGGSDDSMVLLADGRVLKVRGDGAALFDPSTLTWSETGAPANARNQYWTLTALSDGGALLAGGTRNDGSGQVVAERFDPATDSFRPTGSMTFARTQPSAVTLADGRVLVMGYAAEGITTAEIYDPQSERFSVVDDPGAPGFGLGVLLDDGRVFIASLAEAQAILFDPGASDFRPPSGAGAFQPIGGASTPRLDPSMTALRDGTVLVAGGRDEHGTTLATGERFDPTTGTFTPVGVMTSPRVGQAAVLTWQDRVLIAGGNDSAGLTASADIFDPATDTFAPAAPMPEPRAGATGISDPGNDFIVGGVVGEPATETATAVQYGGDAIFLDAPALTSPRSGMTMTLTSYGNLLVAGGSTDGRTVATAEIYNINDAVVTPTGSMAVARIEHAAVRLGDGRVLITGGRTADGTVSPSAEIFDPRTGLFTTVEPMGTARRSHSATLMLDGRVLVAGGFDAADRSLATTEIYDPSTNAYVASPTMGTARAGHGAWLLHDGRVLVLGGTRAGANGELPGPMSAEIFDPSSDQ